MTFKFEGCIKGGILELTDQKKDIAKEPKFYKDMVEWLENRKDVHTLNLSNLGLAGGDIKEFREALQIKPLKYITTLELTGNTSLCEQKHATSGIKEIEKLTEKHLPNLQILKAENVFLLTLPEEIKEFEVNIQNNFPKIRTINTEIPPEAQELKAQLAALLNSNNSPKLPASARNVSNNKSLPLKLEKANNKGIGRQL